MLKFTLILCMALFFVLLGITAYYYRNYCESLAVRWSRRVKKRHLELEQALRKLRNDDQIVWDFDHLEQTLFQNYLTSQSVDQLISFVGIGNGTVDLLRSSRLRNIADVESCNFEMIHGIGPAKAKILRNAVRRIVLDSREHFRHGQCNEGRQFRETVTMRRSQESRESAERAPKIAALASELAIDRKRLAIAERVTFLNFLLGRETSFSNRIAEQDLKSPDEIIDALPKLVPIPIARAIPPIPQTSQVIQSPTSRTIPVAKIAPPTPPPPFVPQPAQQHSKVWTPPPPVFPPPPIPQVAPKPLPNWLEIQSGGEAAPRTTNQVVAKSLPSVIAPTIQQPLRDPFFDGRVPKIVTSEPPSQEPPLLGQLRAMASLGLLMARADGSIDPEERSEIRRFLAEQYGHDDRLVRHIDPAIEEAERRGRSEMDVLIALGTHCPTKTEKLRSYNFALRVADASAGRHAREVALLRRLAQMLGLTDIVPLAEESWPRARIVLPPPPLDKPASPRSSNLFQIDTSAPSSETNGSATALPRLEQLKSWASLGILIAGVDTRISTAERLVIRRDLVDFFGRDLRLIPHIDPLIEQVEKSRPLELVVMKAVLRHCPSEQDKRDVFQFAERIADASSRRNKRESEFLERFAEVLGLNDIAPVVIDIRPTSIQPPLMGEPGDRIRPRPEDMRSKHEEPEPTAQPLPKVVELLRSVEIAPPKPHEPINMRENSLLDDVFGGASEVVTVVISTTVSANGDLRPNDLLDDVFGA